MWVGYVFTVAVVFDVALFIVGAWLVWDFLRTGGEPQAEKQMRPRDLEEGRQKTLGARQASSN